MQTPRMAALQLCCKIEQDGANSNLLLQEHLAAAAYARER